MNSPQLSLVKNQKKNCMSEHQLIQEPGTAAPRRGEQLESGGGDRHPEGPHGVLPRGQAHPGLNGGSGDDGGDAGRIRRRRREQPRLTFE